MTMKVYGHEGFQNFMNFEILDATVFALTAKNKAYENLSW